MCGYINPALKKYKSNIIGTSTQTIQGQVAGVKTMINIYVFIDEFRASGMCLNVRYSVSLFKQKLGSMIHMIYSLPQTRLNLL